MIKSFGEVVLSRKSSFVSSAPGAEAARHLYVDVDVEGEIPLHAVVVCVSGGGVLSLM